MANIFEGLSLTADQPGTVYDFVHRELKRIVFEEGFIVAQLLSFCRDPRSGFDLELQRFDCVIGISPEPEDPPTANEDIDCNVFKSWGIFTIDWRKDFCVAVGVGWRGGKFSGKIVGLVRGGRKVAVREAVVGRRRGSW